MTVHLLWLQDIMRLCTQTGQVLVRTTETLEEATYSAEQLLAASAKLANRLYQ